MKQDKRVRWSMTELEAFGDSENLYSISDKQIQALLTALDVMAWGTRWTDAGKAYYEPFTALLGEALMTPIDICALVAQCVANDSELREAIQDVILGASGANNGGVPVGGDYGSGANYPIQATTDDSNILQNSNCSNDAMYAVCVAIVDIAYDGVQQLFDIMLAADAQNRLLAETLDNLPAATGIPATLLDWASWVIDTGNTLWQVFDTGQQRIDDACALFCIAVDAGCVLSFDDIFQYFREQSPFSDVGETLFNILVRNIAIASPAGVGYSTLSLLFGVLSLGSSFGGIKNVGGFIARAYAFLDEGNNNWTTDCDPCESDAWEVSQSFANSQLNGFTQGIGSFQSPTGFGSLGSGGARIAYLFKNYPQPVTGCNNIVLTAQQADIGTNPDCYIFLKLAGNTVASQLVKPALNTVFQVTIANNVPVFDRIELYFVTSYNALQGYGEHRNILLQGNGGYVPV